MYLQNNEIAALEGILFKNSSKLDSINLSGNKIKSISSQVFANLPELSILYIENNKLNSFDFDCLKSSTKLEEIHLHGSKLTQIQGYRNLKGMLPPLRECRIEGNQFTDASLIIPSFEEQNIESVVSSFPNCLVADFSVGPKWAPASKCLWILNVNKCYLCPKLRPWPMTTGCCAVPYRITPLYQLSQKSRFQKHFVNYANCQLSRNKNN